jgi:hypothetical protein
VSTGQHFTWPNPDPSIQETQAVATRKTATKTKSAARRATKPASHKTKSSTGNCRAAKASNRTGEAEVTIDRRRGIGRRNDDQNGAARPIAISPTRLERRKKVSRRRQIDPTTCERDYTDDEIQFMNALDEYKRTSGRMFPTCSEVLEVVRSLGYVRLSASELTTRQANQPPDQVVEAAQFETAGDKMTDE